jgi:hypothetical protein
LELLEIELDKIDDILSVSVTKQETSRAYKLHNLMLNDYHNKKYTLEEILYEDETDNY